MSLFITHASASDLDAIEFIYNYIHDAEERGEVTTGWIRSVYPVRATAEAALRRQDLFVERDMEDNGRIVGTAIINQTQVDVYDGADWQYDAPESQVMVLHTLVIDPAVKGHGYGKAFVTNSMRKRTAVLISGWIRMSATGMRGVSMPGWVTGKQMSCLVSLMEFRV